MATISTLSAAAIAPVAPAAVVNMEALLAAVETLGNAAHADTGEPRADLQTLAVGLALSIKGKAPKALAQQIAKAIKGMDKDALADALSQLPERLRAQLGLSKEGEVKQTQELPTLESEPVTEIVPATERAKPEEAAPVAKPAVESVPAVKEYPYELKFGWGTATMVTNSSARVALTGQSMVLLSGANFEQKLQAATKEEIEKMVRIAREKAWLDAKASRVYGIITGLFQAFPAKGGKKGNREEFETHESIKLLKATLEAAVAEGDKEVAQKIVVNVLSLAKTEINGRQVIAKQTVNDVATIWGIGTVPAPQSQKPAGNPPVQANQKPEAKPAPVVENKPASEPVSAPVEAQKELPVSNNNTQSATVAAPATEAVQAPVAQAAPPAVEAPVAPASEEVKTEAPANEPEATQASAVEAPKSEPVAEETKPVAEVQPVAPAVAPETKQPASMADCWTALLDMKPSQREVAIAIVMEKAKAQAPNKHIRAHLETLARKIRAMLGKGAKFDAVKKAVKNANKNLLAWITSEYAAHSQEINGLLIKAIETGLQAQEPAGNSPDTANVDEPVNTPASEESEMSNGTRIDMHNANRTETVLEGTVEGEPTKEAPTVELSKEEKAAKAKAEAKAKKEAAKAKKANTPEVMSTVKVGLMAADISVRRFCAPMIPAQEETVKALLNELKAACGESDALVSDVGTGMIPETLRTLATQLVETHAMAKAEHFGPVVSFEASATTDDQKRLAAKLRNDANAEWMANMSNMAAKKMEELLKLAFAGPEGLAKKQALHAAMNYFLGRNETVQKDGRFVTKAGTEALAAKAKDLKGKLDAMKAETAEEKAEKARLAKGLSIFAAVKDDKSYRALRVKLANAKAALARATVAELKDEPMIAKLQGQVAGLEKIGIAVDAVLTGTAELHTWDLHMSGTTASRDMGLLIEAVLNTKFSSVIEVDGKKETRIDGIAGSSEELRGTVGKLAAAMLIREVYQDVQLDLEVREVMEAIKSPKLLEQAAAKPGFRGYARTTAWAIYAGGVYVTLKTAAVLNWAAAPLKAAYYAAKAAGLYGFGFVAEDKEGNRKAVSEALADAKDLIIGFFVLPKDMIVNGAKAGWAKVKSLFGGEKKADVTVTDATKTETPDQGKKEGVMNTISEKSSAVVQYVKEHKLETAGVAAGAVTGGVVAGVVMGAGALVTAGAVVAGAAVVAGGIWAVKKIASWFSGRKAEKTEAAKVETVKQTQTTGGKCDKPATQAGEPVAVANGCSASC